MMADAFYANNLETSPILRTETLQFYPPCSAELFQATDALKWLNLVNNGYKITTTPLDFRCYPTVLPPVVGSCALGIHGLLSVVWLRIADARFRLPLDSTYDKGTKFLIPTEVYVRTASIRELTTLLLEIYAAYNVRFEIVNPNCMAFWHNLCLILNADLTKFELAAGRAGADRARTALDDIAAWTQTSGSRRACLHAAQVYAFMSRRQISDGTMYASEVALFNSALIMSFYLYMAPRSKACEREIDLEPYEILGEVDWNEVGSEGFANESASRNISDSPPIRFIQCGGVFSFGGTIYRGGCGSARKVLTEYIGLLEEVGRWNVAQFCRRLRVLCETVFENNV